MAHLLNFQPRQRPTVASFVAESECTAKHSYTEALQKLPEIEEVLARHFVALDPDIAVESVIDTFGPRYNLDMLINEIVESKPEEWSQDPSGWRALVVVFWLKFLGIEI